jgi:hypothetical protein
MSQLFLILSEAVNQLQPPKDHREPARVDCARKLNGLLHAYQAKICGVGDDQMFVTFDWEDDRWLIGLDHLEVDSHVDFEVFELFCQSEHTGSGFAAWYWMHVKSEVVEA